MTLEEIRELIKVVSETGIAEIEVREGDSRVRIRRVLRPQLHSIAAPGTGMAAPSETAEAATVAATTGEVSEAGGSEPLGDPSLVTVKSPIVGTFYESPSPGSPNFVKPGDSVKPGDVLCIIESMKLMNEIEAEIAGTVMTKFVNNAQPVEYGEALFAIRPF
ncbi:MAG TPA: acetyl-CoA carboxylase biotin carboxyl carrier protein [Bryobacteraceae bacterium]